LTFPPHGGAYSSKYGNFIFLFASVYTEEKFGGDGVPRWNFNDFGQACMMIFRILCGEWIEPLYDSMRATGPESFLFFLTALVIGNFLVSHMTGTFSINLIPKLIPLKLYLNHSRLHKSQEGLEMLTWTAQATLHENTHATHVATLSAGDLGTISKTNLRGFTLGILFILSIVSKPDYSRILGRFWHVFPS